MSGSKAPKPPADLQAAGASLWRGVQTWLGEHPEGLLVLDPHEHAVLVQACLVADRLAELAKALDGADLAADAAAVRLLAEERQQRTTLASLLLVRLGLPTGVVEQTQPRTGGSSTSRRAQRAAQARWSATPSKGVAP